MSQAIRCPKCGREMHEGELFIKVMSSSSDQNVSTSFGFPTGSSFGMQFIVTGKAPFWLERKEETKEFLVKR